MRPVLPATLVLASALLATIGWEVQDATPSGQAPILARTSAVGSPRTLGDADRKQVTQEWVSTTLARPLFREGRRPAATSGDPARTVDEPLRLTGVMTGPFGNRAIFLSAESPKPIVAREGTVVDGFVVRTIEPGLAVLEGSAGNVRTLKPSFGAGERPSPRAQ